MSSERSRRRRNYNPIGTAVAVGVVAYGVYWTGRYAWNAFVSSKKEEEDEGDLLAETSTFAAPSREDRSTSPRVTHPSQAQIRRRLQACANDARTLFLPLSQSLTRQIITITDITTPRQQLKALRKGNSDINILTRTKERELWQAIQTATLTRVVATAYAQTMLHMAVWTHVHWVGQQALQGNNNNTTTTTSMPPTVTAFLPGNTAVSWIVTAVQDAVQHVLQSTTTANDWDVLDPASALCMTRPKLERTIQAITCATVSRMQDPRHWWAHCCCVTTAQQQNSSSSSSCLEMMDLLESPLAERAFQDCIDTTFCMLQEQQQHRIFATQERLPVAKVVASLKSVWDDGTIETYWSHWSTLTSVQDLGRMIVLDGCRPPSLSR